MLLLLVKIITLTLGVLLAVCLVAAIIEVMLP